MRFWDWGQADAEFADWHGARQLYRTPFGPWGDTLDQTETDAENQLAEPQMGDYNADALHHEMLAWIDIGQVKAKIGQVPILLMGAMNVMNYDLGTAGSHPIDIYRMLRAWDQGDTTNYDYDKSAGLTWHLDKHHIVRGQDCEGTPAYTFTVDHASSTEERNNWPLTSIIERALRDNAPILFNIVCRTGNGGLSINWNPSVIKTKRPYLFFAYLFPIEFYHDDGSGNLDLSSPVTDDPGDEYYLGAVEPGQTGTAVKEHFRNFSALTQQVEIFDDHPEYTTPITRVGSTTLDHVGLVDNAVSQKYNIIFYSSTQFEVKAVAYRDNAISLHPSIDADPTWRGSVGSDFTAPDGGLLIPSAAWQPGTALDDDYETGVRGQTTDSGWAADSNDQIQITRDNAGSPDAAGWRPCLGRRETTTAQTTIGATTKLIPTRRVIPANWPVATRAFIMDETNINEGAIASVQEADIGTPSFSGTGSDDITISGNFNGAWNDTLRAKIDGTGTPNTFTWSINGGSSWEETGVDCSTTDILLPGSGGIYLKWTSTTGHVLDDYWDSVIKSWAIELSGLTANSNVYNSGSRIGTTLPIRDVSASVFSTVDQASGVSEGVPARVWVLDTDGMSPGQDVFIQNPLDPDTAETREIDSVQAGSYIDLTVALTQDYPTGSLVAVIDSGQASFWSKPVAEVTTTEEVKRLRFNARLL
jgi:hypothetical protein